MKKLNEKLQDPIFFLFTFLCMAGFVWVTLYTIIKPNKNKPATFYKIEIINGGKYIKTYECDSLPSVDSFFLDRNTGEQFKLLNLGVIITICSEEEDFSEKP